MADLGQLADGRGREGVITVRIKVIRQRDSLVLYKPFILSGLTYTIGQTEIMMNMHEERVCRGGYFLLPNRE